MQIYEKLFDRDMALFDASSTLTYFRLLKSQQKGLPSAVLSAKTQILEEAQGLFPRMYQAFQNSLVGSHNHYELLFWGLGEQEQQQWEDITICGPCRIYFINTRRTSPYAAGTVIDLQNNEDIILNYKDMVYGFVVVTKSVK